MHARDAAARRAFDAALDAALDRFAGTEPGRSIAVSVLGGGSIDGGSIGGGSWSGGRCADVTRPAGSLLKVPLVMAVVRAARRGTLALSDTVRRSDLPRSSYASFVDVLDDSHVFTVRELCGLALATSDNPVAEHLLALTGFDAVAELLTELGCADTRLEVGFADEMLGTPGRANVTTAADALRIVRALHVHDELAFVRYAMERSLHGNRIPLRLSGTPGISIAHKTGSLAGVCNDIGIVTDGAVSLAVAVLCDAQDDVARTAIDIGDCVGELWCGLRGSLPE